MGIALGVIYEGPRERVNELTFGFSWQTEMKPRQRTCPKMKNNYKTDSSAASSCHPLRDDRISSNPTAYRRLAAGGSYRYRSSSRKRTRSIVDLMAMSPPDCSASIAAAGTPPFRLRKATLEGLSENHLTPTSIQQPTL